MEIGINLKNFHLGVGYKFKQQLVINMRISFKVLSAVLCVLLLSACSNRIKQKVGIATTGPDEYQVHRNNPLEVPPHYDLPTPSALHDKRSGSVVPDTDMDPAERAMMKELNS